MNLLLLAMMPFAGAVALAWVPNSQRRLAALVAGAAALGSLTLVLVTAPPVFGGEILRWSVDWLPTLGLTSAFAWTDWRGCSRC